MAAFIILSVPLAAYAVCPPSCPITGGGPAETDCHAEFATAQRLNFPPHDPAAPEPARELRCFDGDAGCDVGGAFDHMCVFDIDVCLRNADPNLASCTPSDIVAVEVEGTDACTDLAALQTALDSLLPATSNVCTQGQMVGVPVGRADANNVVGRGQKTVRLTVRTQDGTTVEDRLELSCLPRGWASHGYNHANHRSTPFEVAISPSNIARLELKWRADFGPSVTSTPLVGNGLVYATTWAGDVHALRPENGEIAWTHHSTGAAIGSAALTADGRLLATAGTLVVCLDATDGKLLWSHDVRVDEFDTVWASPQVANGRVFIGVASVSDTPCVQGRLFALDLDTGEELWTLETVPDQVCDNDTAIECTGDGDCAGGTCVKGRGGGITATVAVDPTGEIVYMNTVGCYTFPSIGDSDSIFKIDAASGDVIWKKRVQPPEQFAFCPMDGAKDCRTQADCATGQCRPKSNFHDFGFLNGPMLVDADDGAGGIRSLVASASKDGTLYALDPADGMIVWTNPVRPTPVTPSFAGFGLFNGAPGFANGRFFATLDGFPTFRPPLTEHLYAFDASDGSTVWQEEIGVSWGSVGIANGVVFAGAGTFGPDYRCADDESLACIEDVDCPTGTCVPRGIWYAYDASSGERLREFALPANVASGASIVDGNVYVGYGIFGGGGGVAAFELPSCLGDCNYDFSVAIDELVRGVNIGLGLATMELCPSFDGDESGGLTVDELVLGVGNSIEGCD